MVMPERPIADAPPKEAKAAFRVVDGIEVVRLGHSAACVFNPRCFRPLRIEGEYRRLRRLLDGPLNGIPPSLAALLEQHAIATRSGTISIKDSQTDVSQTAALALSAATRDGLVRLADEWPSIVERAGDTRPPPARIEVWLAVDAKRADLPAADACRRLRDIVAGSKANAALHAQIPFALAAKEADDLAQILKPAFRFTIDCPESTRGSQLLDGLVAFFDAGFRPNLLFPLTRRVTDSVVELLEDLTRAWKDDFTYDFDFPSCSSDLPDAGALSRLLKALDEALMQHGRIAYLYCRLSQQMGKDLTHPPVQLLFADPSL